MKEESTDKNIEYRDTVIVATPASTGGVDYLVCLG